jgi:hypothetical protein
VTGTRPGGGPDFAERVAAQAAIIARLSVWLDPALPTCVTITPYDGAIEFLLLRASLRDGQHLAERIGLPTVHRARWVGSRIRYEWADLIDLFPVRVALLLGEAPATTAEAERLAAQAGREKRTAARLPGGAAARRRTPSAAWERSTDEVLAREHGDASCRPDAPCAACVALLASRIGPAR